MFKEEETHADLLARCFKENDLPLRPRLWNKTDGNSWFAAIADQGVLHGIKDTPATHEAMRGAVCDALITLPQTQKGRGMDGY